MADWDADGLQLEHNLSDVLEAIRLDAGHRVLPSLDAVRRRHIVTFRNLDVPNPRYVGSFRGESGLEKVQAHIGAVFAVPAER